VWAVPYPDVAYLLSVITESWEGIGSEVTCWASDAAVKRNFIVRLILSCTLSKAGICYHFCQAAFKSIFVNILILVVAILKLT
jgi:hypothetical protein